MSTRPCTCAPDERPYPCQHKYALGECRKAHIRELRAEVEALRHALRAFVGCQYPVSTEIDERGYRWSEAYLDEALSIANAALRGKEPGNE
jgi:hypothetical protein